MINPGMLDDRMGAIVSILSSHCGEELTADSEHHIDHGEDVAALLRALQDVELVSHDFGFYDAGDSDGFYGFFTKQIPTSKGPLTVTLSGLDFDREFNGPRDHHGYTAHQPIRAILRCLLDWLDYHDRQASAQITALQQHSTPQQADHESMIGGCGPVSVVPLRELVSAARAGVELFGTAGDPHDVLSMLQVDALQRVAEAYADETGDRPAVAMTVLLHDDPHGQPMTVSADEAGAPSAIA